MGKYTEACDNSTAFSNVATKGINESPTVGRVNEAFWASSDFKFTSIAAAKDQGNWDAAVASGNIIYLGEVEASDASAEREIFENKNLGIKYTTESATRVYNFISQNCACTHAELSKMSGRAGRLFVRTKLNYVIGRLTDAKEVIGQPIGELYVGYKQLVGSDNPGYTPMEVTYSDPQGDDQNPCEFKTDWAFSEADQVDRAEGVASAVSTSGTVLSFSLALTKGCTDIALTGSVTANYKVVDANGANIATFTATDTAGTVAFSVTTAETLVYVSLDGIQTINTLLYIMDNVKASTV
jgi:hypothetical protein